jgi:hypothetical protein
MEAPAAYYIAKIIAAAAQEKSFRDRISRNISAAATGTRCPAR